MEEDKIVFKNDYLHKEPRDDQVEELKGSICGYYNEIETKWKNEKYLQILNGLPGAGKSFLLRMLVEKLRTDKKYDDKFICNIDISDCVDEISVYYKIMLELERFTHGESGRNLLNGEQKKALKVFLVVHEWIYGSAGRYPDHPADSKKNSKIIESLIKEKAPLLKRFIAGRTITFADSIDFMEAILEKISPLMPLAEAIQSVAGMVMEQIEEKKLKNLFLNMLEAFQSKNRREYVLRELLILAMPKLAFWTATDGKKVTAYPPVIIMDNYQISKSSDIGRDHLWLSKMLMQRIDAFWIVSGRMVDEGCFENAFSENQMRHMELDGFTEDQARKYLEKSCENFWRAKGRTENELGDILTELRGGAVLDKMMAVCRADNFGHQGKKLHGARQREDEAVSYLPYLLRLVMLHYYKLAEDPSNPPITEKSFIELRSQEDFIGYYFYKDLSDLMLNAFQILSCIGVWDEAWLQLVRERFDNHLLNARNLLFKTAPMEQLGDGGFKLHEAIKDGLYNHSANYIKLDVLEFLYQKLIELYSGEEAGGKKEVWQGINRLQTFLEAANEYIRMMKGKEDRAEAMEGIGAVMGRQYNANEARGAVTESFIRIYSQYVDLLKRVYRIPFIDVRNAVLEKDNLESLKNDVKERIDSVRPGAFPDIGHITEHMNGCYKLANLYTNINQSGTARVLEELCAYFWEAMEESARRAGQGKDVLKQCRLQRIKFQNAFAYDSSQEQDYDSAYKVGDFGLQMTEEAARAIIESLQDEDADRFRRIANPEEWKDFSVDDYAEIGKGVYRELKEGYQTLHKWRQNAAEGESKSKEILSELLLEIQQNLRGNFPWYCLKANPPGEEVRLRGDDIWKYGARTYWMRRASVEALEELEPDSKKLPGYRRRMLQSYHNVCVYLYKCGKPERACMLSHEVLEEERLLFKPQNFLSPFEWSRIQNISGSANQMGNEQEETIFEYLWRMEEDGSKQPKRLKEDPLVLETMQYMGDYYLHMKFYPIAFKHFSRVSLGRYIRFGIMDNKTLDSYIRLMAAAYLYDKDVFDKAVKFANETILNDTLWNGWQASANGLRAKIKCIQKLIDYGNKESDEKLNVHKEIMEIIG